MPAQLKGSGTVRGSKGTNLSFNVNFDTGECDCKHGQAWRWDNRRWVPNSFCSHKLKALASLITRDGDEDLIAFHTRQIGLRYNAFNAVSAMHKEIRLGNSEDALYWAMAMLPHRGAVGVINYLRNIVFEETRDINLYRYILKLSSYGRAVTVIQMQHAVVRFARAPKKWELPWRLDIFLDEMRGYQLLVKQYGKDVAKPKDIIPLGEARQLAKAMLKGFEAGDRKQVQYGLKGWFKSKSQKHDRMLIEIFNMLTDIYTENFANAFEYDHDYADQLQKLILRKIENHGAPAYHELNAFADALAGEHGADPSATLPDTTHKLIVNSPRFYTPPMGDLKRIPLYAHDNHTWDGKRLMRQYGKAELQPNATQTHLDFRICGAYMGVAWRYLAFSQHSTIDCKWGDVSWRSPNWLWGHLDQMWY
jgi:hypothetical protein